jgi:hypothetical protein
MANPFSRTIRSLNADGFKPNLIGLGFAVILFLGWIIWFFGASVIVTELAVNSNVINDEKIEAVFSKSNSRRIIRGQTAWLRIENSAESTLPTVIPAKVSSINKSKTNSSQVVVELVRIWEKPYYKLEDKEDVVVTVEIGSISPAQFLAKTTGLFTSSWGAKLGI